jgi:hypothetical protein
MDLKSLRPSLLELTNEEAMRLILGIRNNRMISKRVVKEKKKSEEKQKKQVSLDINNLSIDDLESLIKKMEGT